MNTAKLNVAILIYPGVELMDMNGPTDVFVKANRYNGDRYEIFTVAERKPDIVSETSTVRIKPKYSFATCPRPDIIVIPGQVLPEGYGYGSPALIKWIKKQAKNSDVTIMSVCVGAYILANTGLLNNKKATTHWSAISGFQEKYPDIEVIKNVRFVPDKNIVSTGGVTSGIDGALHLVGILDGDDIAQKVANIMVYNTKAPLPPGTILQ